MPKKTKLKEEFDQPDQKQLIDLVDELTPRISHEQSASLLNILNDAQTNLPTDKKAFVDRVNRVFDLYRICISVGDDQIYRLRYLPGGSGKGHIYLMDGNRKSSNLFVGSQLQLIDIGTHFNGNTRVSGMSNDRCPVLATD